MHGKKGVMIHMIFLLKNPPVLFFLPSALELHPPFCVSFLRASLSCFERLSKRMKMKQSGNETIGRKGRKKKDEKKRMKKRRLGP